MEGKSDYTKPNLKRKEVRSMVKLYAAPARDVDDMVYEDTRTVPSDR